MNRLLKTLARDSAILIHALIAGCAYFVIALRFFAAFTSTAQGGMFLGFMFAPAIICGAAVILIKQMRAMRKRDNLSAIGRLALCDAALLVMAAVFGAELVMRAI